MSVRDAFRERRPFPGADPWVLAWEGEYLLVAAAGGNRRIVIRRFADLEHPERHTETLVWAPSGPTAHLRQLWAPELHHLEGRWYLYFSAGDGRAGSHRNYALVSDHPLGPYLTLGPVADPAHDHWAIDLSVFSHGGRLYGVWSGWEGPADGFPQNLYLAPMANPWTISGERSCLSRPTHGWEMSVAPVNEGPEVVRHPATGRPFILFSADASWTQAYKMGVLAWEGGDVADPQSWTKLPRPLLSGGGHGCVVETPGGSRLVYHRKLGPEPGWADREIRSIPFGWDAEGYPVVGQSGTWTGESVPVTSAMPPGGFVPVGPPNGLDHRAA